jgi:predicted lipoprotein with Yx(FWY)xxD motif
MMTSRTGLRTSVAAALLGVSLLVAACGSSSPSSNTSSVAATPTTSSSGSSSAAVSIGTAKSGGGTYLTGASGRALYLWEADSSGKSNCSGACAGAWPPLITKATPVASAGVKAADLGTITRSDGAKQVTYDGHPLYYFVGDQGPNSTSGQGSDQFGAKWWLVAPSGAAITRSTSSGSSSSGSSSAY